MATKAQHTQAVLSMRLEWSAGDKILAVQLANLRYTIERKSKLADKSDLTVVSAAGTEKSNPLFMVLDKLKTQELQLTKRLGLQASIRNASHNYEINANPTDKRGKLWTEWRENCISNLLPGCWVGITRDEKCGIPEDELGWPNNPLTLPVPGEVHEHGNYYPVSHTPRPR
ncbi:hypothetical protein [Caballeronia sordidicola]|uniref:hypothetical protein n=1 Tax=Caballeronia sordidicola TaxID=196367 RepID=UPI000B793E57|nr:hypothetical protein [Caballeronia sordidicola]